MAASTHVPRSRGQPRDILVDVSNSAVGVGKTNTEWLFIVSEQKYVLLQDQKVSYIEHSYFDQICTRIFLKKYSIKKKVRSW